MHGTQRRGLRPRGKRLWRFPLFHSSGGGLDLQNYLCGVWGQVTLIEAGLGTTRARVVGSWNDANAVEARLEQFTAEVAVPVMLPKSGTLKAKFDPATGAITGAWQATRDHSMLEC